MMKSRSLSSLTSISLVFGFSSGLNPSKPFTTAATSPASSSMSVTITNGSHGLPLSASSLAFIFLKIFQEAYCASRSVSDISSFLPLWRFLISVICVCF